MSEIGRASKGERFRRRLVRALGIPLFVMVLVAAALNAQIGYLISVNRHAEHVNRVVSLGYQIDGAFVELDASLRSYLATGDELLLDRYRHMAQEVDRTLAELVEAEHDEPEMVKLASAVVNRKADWDREAARAVDARQGRSTPQPRARARANDLMKSMRATVRQILQAEEQERAEEKARAERATWLLAGTSFGFTIVAALVLSLYARRQVQRVSARYAHAMWVAEEALRAREEFLTIASHELKTPLTALRLQVGCALRSLKAGPKAPPPAYLMARIQAADRQADRLSHLVAALLDSSRVTAGKLELALEEVDLAALAREVVARSQETLRRAGCRVELHADAPVVGRWDRLRLDQAVTNLLSNAVKYGRGKPIEIRVGVEGDRARFAIRDQGIGVAPERKERIFERFERAVSLRHYGGFGLGLWFVRRIAVAQGGTVQVESRPGAGATFTLELPRAAAEAAAEVEARAVVRA